MNKEILSEAQKKAIEHMDGPMMVLAGPGSGKTFVITRRLVHMIENGIKAENILVITFTKNSALEMEERFKTLVKNDYCPVNFGTFHSIFFYIIRESLGFDSKCLISEKEKYTILRNSIESVREKYPDEDIDDSYFPMFLSSISKLKNEGITPDKLNEANFENGIISYELFKELYYIYQEMLASIQKIDFDDMLVLCKDLLVNNYLILNKWQNTYKYILIDEFQDINALQFDIVNMLVKANNNLFVVGDDDQSIYAFRGSKPEIMLGFKDYYPDAKSVLLDTNYRSSEDIVNKARSFIETNKKRYFKAIKAHNKSNNKVILKSFNDLEEESKYIIKIIKTALRTSNYDDIALIYRTNKAARFMTTALTNAGIPYRFKEKPVSFYSTTEIKTVMDMLAYANGNHSRHKFLSFMNKPVRYIPRDLFSANEVELASIDISNCKPYLRKNISKLIYDLNCIKQMDMYSAVNYIYKVVGYEKFIIEEAKAKKKDVKEVNELLSLFKENCKGLISFQELLDKESYYEEMLNGNLDNKIDGINIMTMHGSKGLEFKSVIIPDINEGYIPSIKSKDEESLEEERRVFYVAMTRAKEKLYLLYLEKNINNKNDKSRFLNEINGLEEFSC